MRATQKNEKIGIVIVTFGIGGHLKRCLDSIRNQTYPALEIMVIDNSPDDVFGRGIREYFPQAIFYRSTGNLFYTGSLNEGVKHSNAEFILCLNDDVVLDKEFIAEALRGFDFDSRVGMVSGKILRSEGKTIDSTGLFLSPWRAPKERGYGIKDRGQYEKEGYIFGVTGAAAFYRRKMLEDIKTGTDYFDADYHFFYEDLDIAWRAQNAGWKGFYIPKAIAYHVRGASVRQGRGIGKPYARVYLSDELHLDLLKNRYLTLIKNESFLDFILYLPFILFYDILMWAYVLFFKPKQIIKFITNVNYIRRALNKR